MKDYFYAIMNKKLLILLFNLLLCCTHGFAQETEKSELQQRAEAESAKGNIASTRFLYIRAFEDYAKKGKLQQGTECGTKAAALYYKENLYKEAFDLLRLIDQTIIAAKDIPFFEKEGMHYLTTNERMQMYIKLKRAAQAQEQLNTLAKHAEASGKEKLKNDLLYNKAIYYYTFGITEKGNAAFKEMATKLTASKDYNKVDEVYKSLIANGRKSNSASMVAQSYSSYVAWKDSVNALKLADETGALKQRIAENEATIAEKDDSLASRKMIIIGLCVLAVALAAVLVVGGLILLRFIFLTRKQKKTIRLSNENNALKAKFISNISAQLTPALKKLDRNVPEVRALQDFSEHIQTLSELECSTDESLEKEDIQVAQLCEELMDEIRGKVKPEVQLKVNVPKMSVMLNQKYVTHILRHLLNNAAEYTPEGGHITLDFKKRGVHKYQFLILDTGCGIPEEKQEDVFKAFLEIKDLTKGDGLGLPICKQMAMKMDGDLTIDPTFTKGTRFVLDLYA